MRKSTAESYDELNKAMRETFLLFCKTFWIERFVVWLNKKLDKESEK